MGPKQGVYETIYLAHLMHTTRRCLPKDRLLPVSQGVVPSRYCMAMGSQ